MDDTEFKKTAKRLKDISGVVSKLDPSMREGAWELLRPFAIGEAAGEPSDAPDGSSPKKERSQNRKVPRKDSGAKAIPDALPPSAGDEELIEQFESNRDADNLYLALAIFFKHHGRGPVSTTQLKKLAKDLSLDIPARPDMTFNSKKGVIRKMGDGWKIMPGGETFLEKTYGVKRGKTPLPSSDGA